MSPVLPPGSCDCHFHVFDAARYAYAERRHYTPADATMADYLAMCARFGIERSVLVHPTVFGADHRCFEDLLQTHADRLRGVAVVSPDTPDEDIARWHALGARGTRVTNIFAGDPDLDAIGRIVAKVRPFGWHLQVLVDVAVQPRLPMQLAGMGVPLVVDHLGHHPAAALQASAGWANLLGLLADDGAWVKLSAPYRLSDAPAEDAALLRLVHALARANPRQLVWGTDWPHPNSPHPVPNDAALVGLLPQWLPDASLREAVLVHNPTRLYWTDESANPTRSPGGAGG